MWLDTKSFPQILAINKLGQVKSLKRKGVTKDKILKLIFDKDGYCIVNFGYQGVKYKAKVHRLIAEVFHLNPDNLPQVNHKDGIRKNNTPFNLEWCDSHYNNFHKTLRIKELPPGVLFHKRNNKYSARFTFKQKTFNLGYYDTPTEAYQVYLEKRAEYIN